MAASAVPLVVRDGVDTLEPNDSRRTAHGPVKSGESHASYISTIGDQDFFKVTVAKHSRTLTATLSDVPDYCSYDLALYDSSGKQLAYRINKEQKDETITLAHPRAGIYYVLVKQARNCDRYRPYTLRVTIR